MPMSYTEEVSNLLASKLGEEIPIIKIPLNKANEVVLISAWIFTDIVRFEITREQYFSIQPCVGDTIVFLKEDSNYLVVFYRNSEEIGRVNLS